MRQNLDTDPVYIASPTMVNLSHAIQRVYDLEPSTTLQLISEFLLRLSADGAFQFAMVGAEGLNPSHRHVVPAQEKSGDDFSEAALSIAHQIMGGASLVAVSLNKPLPTPEGDDEQY